MKTPPPTFHVYWGRITFAAAAAFALASIPAVLTGQWARFGTGAALVAIGALIAVLFFNLGHAAARAERAFQVEAARGTDADPDPFATQLRIEYRDDLTYDVTVGLHGLDNPELLRGLTRNQLIATLATHGVPAPSGDTVKATYVIAGGKRITWAESTTDTTGETR